MCQTETFGLFPKRLYTVSLKVNASNRRSRRGWQNRFAKETCTALLSIRLMLLWGRSIESGICAHSAWCWPGIWRHDVQNWEKDRPAQFSAESMDAAGGLHLSGSSPALNIITAFTSLSPGILVNLASEWFNSKVIYDTFWIHSCRSQNQFEDLFMSMAFVAVANCFCFFFWETWEKYCFIRLSLAWEKRGHWLEAWKEWFVSQITSWGFLNGQGHSLSDLSKTLHCSGELSKGCIILWCWP